MRARRTKRTRRTFWLVLVPLAIGWAWGCGSRSAKPSDMGYLDAALSDLPLLPDGVTLDVPVLVPDGPAIDVPTIDVAVPDSVVPPDSPPPPDTIPPPDTVPQPDTVPGTSAWTVMVASTPGVLNDLWGTSASNLIAVGKGGLIMRYDGGSWSKMTSSTTVDLEGIWGNSSSNIFAVGKGGDIHFDGVSWKKGSTSSNYTFHDVWLALGGSYVFAVGETGYGAQLRYKQASNPTGYWSSVPLYSLTQQPLHGIWGLFESEIYVVGDSGTILQCTGTCTGYSSGWKLMTSGTTYHLRDLFGFSSKSIFAVGLNGTILHYDGSSWSKMTTNSSTYFYGVWGSSPSDVYAVGHPIFKADESIFHYDGSSWKKLPPPKTSYLNAVWGMSKSDVFAVGNFNILKLK